MSRDDRKNQKRYWYSVSVDSLRASFALAVVVVALIAGFLGYRYWDADRERRTAGQTIEEARSLIERLNREPGLSSFRSEYREGNESFKKAEASYEAEDFGAALTEASSSLNTLQRIFDELTGSDTLGEARFITVDGNVDFKRGESEEWESARGRVSLANGDYVRTGRDGSAAIMLASGTLYTIRPNTLIKIGSQRSAGGGGQEQSMAMEYGWVNLATRNQESSVSTPDSEARVESQSQASVSYDRESQTGRFASYQGALRVVAKRGGVERRITGRKQVIQQREELSEPRELPTVPTPSDPADNFQIGFGEKESVRLAWEPVPSAQNYALQVARDQLFVDNVIDVKDRGGTFATLGIRGQGTFWWRVAAVTRDGSLGPWSQHRRFRVTALTQASEADSTPPPLELEDIEDYGNIFIVTGVTEPGAEVRINDEAVAVEADGSFTKSIQFSEPGQNLLVIRARDAWGNESETQRKVFVEAY